MEPGGSMPNSQGLSNNPYPEPSQPNSSLMPISLRSILILSSHLRLDLPNGLIPVGLPDNNNSNNNNNNRAIIVVILALSTHRHKEFPYKNGDKYSSNSR